MKINTIDKGTIQIEIGTKVFYNHSIWTVDAVDPNNLWPEESPLGLWLKAGNGRTKHLTGKQIYQIRIVKNNAQ